MGKHYTQENSIDLLRSFIYSAQVCTRQAGASDKQANDITLQLAQGYATLLSKNSVLSSKDERQLFGFLESAQDACRSRGEFLSLLDPGIVDMRPWKDLSPEDIMRVRAVARSHPWGSRAQDDERDPFEWVLVHYGAFIPGLTLIMLEADKLLYYSFAQAVKRHGLPDWLDVPTNDGAMLRREPSIERRLVRLASREAVKRLARLGRKNSAMP